MIDSHSHISDPQLDQERQNIIDNLSNDGLSAILEVGYDMKSSLQAIELANNYNQIYAIIGLHPENVNEYDDKFEQFILTNSNNSKVVGIGEIGLDYYWTKNNKPKQKEVFENQLCLSQKAGLPVVLHIRDAYADAYDILMANKAKLNNGILLHCYSGSDQMVKQFNKLDCYFALGGAVTFKNAHKDDVIKAIPKDRLLIETDCPYMTPTPYRGKTNQPKFIRFTADKIADVLGIHTQHLIDQTMENTQTLFTKINLTNNKER